MAETIINRDGTQTVKWADGSTSTYAPTRVPGLWGQIVYTPPPPEPQRRHKSRRKHRR